MPGGYYSTSLRYGDLNFRVHSPVESHLRWIEEFLSPHFSVKAGDGPAIEIRLEIDSERYMHARRHLQEEGEMPCFVLDSSVVNLPAFSSPESYATLYDRHYRSFFSVSSDRLRGSVLIKKDNVRIRAALMRVIREYAMNYAQSQGGFFLHASSFLAGGRPLIVAGPKNAGKTTLLLFACLHGGGAFLANDRVLVREHSGEHLLRGMPAIVNIRMPSVSFFPDVGRHIRERELHFRLNSREKPGDVHPRPVIGKNNRYAITPRQFCAITGASQAKTARNPVIIFPRITGRHGVSTLRRISPPEAAELLEHSLFGVRHWVAATPVYNLAKEAAGPSPEFLLDKCRSFTAGHPCIGSEIGTDLYSDPRNAALWIRSIFDLAEGDEKG